MPLTSISQLEPAPRLIRACFGETLDRPPVWLMRQAGRYLPEYQAIRQQVDFLTLCKTPDLAVEVSLQPYRIFGMDGVILFSDILVPAEAMGMRLEFTDKGPCFPEPLRSKAMIDKLCIPDPEEKTGFVMDIVRRLRQALRSNSEAALIGFAGAPWTLASYMIEGGVSRNFTGLKAWMYNDPETLHTLLHKLAETVILYLNAQIAAGVQVVQLFDTWAGILAESEYRTFILPYQQQVIQGISRRNVPVILYVNGSAHLLEAMAETGPDVISVDALTPLDVARQRVSEINPNIVLQGNLDPNILFARTEIVRQKVTDMLSLGGNQGYICNLGHGVLPETPRESVTCMIETVKNHICKPALSGCISG